MRRADLGWLVTIDRQRVGRVFVGREINGFAVWEQKTPKYAFCVARTSTRTLANRIAKMLREDARRVKPSRDLTRVVRKS
jgi:hypothetical protein